ncbi:histidine kinase [Salinisphaera sp. T31B1]
MVLFIDDEPLIRKYFERAFGRDMNVCCAASGEEARLILADPDSQIAVVMTDQRMPVEDGVTLLGHVKDEWPQIVRILTTAYSEIEDAIAAVNSGEIWRYVTKPWDFDELRTLLHSALEVYHARAYEATLLAERRRGMMMVASHIAHEMRTPLRSIHSAATGIERYLPRLLAGYDWAIQAGAEIEPMTQRHRDVLAQAALGMQRVADRANGLIDLLLANAGAYRIDAEAFERCDMVECVDVVLRDFPFGERERELVHWSPGPGFEFVGSFSLMVFVLQNLLRNALQAIAAAGQGEIVIWTRCGAGYNGLHMRDTGIGIEREHLPRIFDDFTSFAGARHSAGVGLGFCRKVITSFGGHIDCHSEHRRYTQFDLWLPVCQVQQTAF